MIRGYFRVEGPRRRPYIDVAVRFPIVNNQLEISFLIDTGADRTILSPFDASRLREQFGLDLFSLPRGVPSGGVGGRAATRHIEATLTIGDFSRAMTLAILEPPPDLLPTMPSLLGRDVIYDFDLFLSSRTDRVFFLDADEGDALNLPAT